VGTQEEERRRISRELHDQLGQLLTAMRLRLESLAQDPAPDSVRESVKGILESTKGLEAEVDFLAWELRPSMLDDMGLARSLESYVREWEAHTGIPGVFHAAGLNGRRLTWLLETNFYRIAQEAMNNIAKHSQAISVEILLELRGGDIVLIVEDNGRGFSHDNNRNSDGREIGLAGIHERAALMKGTVEIESAEGKGTTIYVRVPAKYRSDEENTFE
jgi:signal transduction histidine kinase